MSEHITHLAVCDDARRLAVHSEAVDEALRDALSEHARMCRYGSSCNWGGRHFVVPGMSRYRDGWGDPDGDLPMRAAFVVGRITHNAGDAFFKPVTDELGRADGRSSDEAEQYHDAVVLQEVFDGASVDPFAPGVFSTALSDHAGAPAIDTELAETYFGGYHQVALLRRYRAVATAGADLARPTTATTVEGLSPGTDHEITVSAVDGAGNESDRSDPVVVSTQGNGDGKAPPPPSDLSTTSTTEPAVALEWRGADEAVDHYSVYVDGVRHHAVDASTTETTVDRHARESGYDVHVTAVDGAGRESGPSNAVSVPADDQSPFGDSPQVVPGTVSFGLYDTGGEGVAYYDTTEGNEFGNSYRDGTNVDVSSGGDNIGWVANGEWLEATVKVETTGLYEMDLSFTSDGGGGVVHVASDGRNVTGPITVSDTGGWGTWETMTVGDVALSAGEHVFRIYVEQHGLNIGETTFRLVTRDATAPTQPSGLAASDVSAARAGVEWDPTTDRTTGVDRYNVYVDGELDHVVAADRTVEVESLLNTAVSAHEPFYVDFDRLTSILQSPDPAKQEHYIEEPNFYDGSDPAVATARAIQAGEDPDGVHDAATTGQESQYAACVADAYHRIERAGAFLAGDIGVDAFREVTGQ